MDLDGNGTISFEEFSEMMVSRQINERKFEEEMRDVFTVFDRQHTGYISAPGLRHVLMNLGEPSVTLEQARDMLASVDLDGDGHLSYEEFLHMMKPN